MTWQPQALEDLCLRVTSGGTPRTSRSEYYDGEIPWLRTQEVNFNRIFETEIHITDDAVANSSAKWIPERCVIVAMYGASAGRVAMNQIPLTTNQACCNLIIDPAKADYRFVYYRLMLDYDILHQMAKGAAQDNLNAGQLRAYQIEVPPVPAQQRIADVLSCYDSLIDNNQRRIALLGDAALQLYREWFVRLRFPGHEHTRLVDGVPDGWRRTPLGENITLRYGKALKADDRVEGPYPVFGSSGVVGSHEAALVSGPGIIVGRKGNVGSVYWSSEDFYPIDTVYFIESVWSNLYLYYALKHMHFMNTDVAVPGLNRDFAHSRLLLHPPDVILQQFIEAVTPLHAQIDKLNEACEKSNAARDLLLPRLMNGTIAA